MLRTCQSLNPAGSNPTREFAICKKTSSSDSFKLKMSLDIHLDSANFTKLWIREFHGTYLLMGNPSNLEILQAKKPLRKQE